MLAGVIASVGMPMVMLYDLAPVCPFASVATAVKLKVPDAVGVPEISPAAERVKPLGGAPAPVANAYGPCPPAAVSVATYGVPACPLLKVAGSMEIAAAATTSV